MNYTEIHAGQAKFEALRKEYPFLEYSGYVATIEQVGLVVTYTFNLSDKHIFSPSFTIPRKRFLKKFLSEADIESELFQNILFHIGMIELISYWKCACPPQVRINHELNEIQKSWFKNVYFQGLGEFFYTNSIQSDIDTFMNISSQGRKFETQSINLDDTTIVPIGGGKDSVVTLELLKNEVPVRPFIMNPRGATLECVRVSGFGNDGFFEVNRRIDPLLIELNRKGFLNGHTPFSAMLAFYTLLVSYISGHKNIALSNESSANEPTVPGTDINHQYSKSFAFESDFRNYVRQFISPDFNYFSFLRPLNELQIARHFAEQVKYYPVFKSCNAGSKTDSWCCNCSKCLFAFTILSPFIPFIELVNIFGKNLFDKPEMLPFLKELTGIEEVKPFECVGTVDEVNTALHLFISKHHNKKLPLLIDYYSNTTCYQPLNFNPDNTLLNEFNNEHFLSDIYLSILRKNGHDRS